MIDNLSVQGIKEKMNNNKQFKMMIYAIVGLLVLIIGFLLYNQFISKPANEKSKDAYWIGLNLASKDSTDAAIDELSGVVKKYDGKIGGENAQFVLARQYMAKGQFQKALDELEGVNLNDTYLSAMSIGLQGDCRSEMKQYDKALDLYVEASEKSENEFTTPMYLFKAGLCAEQLKDYEKATEYYTTIKDNYPQYANQKAIEKYIARTSNNIVK